MQTLNALEVSDTELDYVGTASRSDATWIPVRKFKHGKWKVKWKTYEQPSGNQDLDESRQANREYESRGYEGD